MKMDFLRQIATDIIEQAQIEACAGGLRLRLTCSRHSSYSRQVGAAMFIAGTMRIMITPASWERLSIRADPDVPRTQIIEQPARTAEEFNDVLNAMRAACREIGVSLDHHIYTKAETHEVAS